jgi:hypothetical protein
MTGNQGSTTRFSCIFLLLFSLVLIPACSSDHKRPEFEDPIFPLEQLQEDFTQLRNMLELLHPAVYRYSSEAEMDAMFDSAYQSLQDEMSLLEFYRVLAPVVAGVNCGHTWTTLPVEWFDALEQSGLFFPYGVVFLDDRAYVYQDYSETSELELGTEILSINERPIDTIQDTIMAGLETDGSNVTGKLIVMKWAFRFFYLTLVEHSETFDLSILAPGEQQPQSKIIDGEPVPEVRQRAREQSPFPEPLLYELLAEPNTALLTVNTFLISNAPDYSTFLRDSFQDMIDNQVENLIIDLRNNGGGDPPFSADLLAYLMSEPFTYFAASSGYPELLQPMDPHDIHFSGNVFALIGGGCFSSTNHFLSLVKHHGLATLVGEETAGSYYCSASSTETTLHNSSIRAMVAKSVFATDVTGFEIGPGIMPDVTVVPTLDDILTGADPVMDEVLNIIRSL